MTLLVRTEDEAIVDAASEDVDGGAPQGVSLLWVLAFVAAFAALGWLAWPSGDDTLVDGRLEALARAGGEDGTREHALLQSATPATWTLVADADALGRGGSSAVDDMRAVLGGDVGAIAPVPAVQLRSGLVAWASPRQAWIVDPGTRDDVARVDVCSDGVDAVVQVADRLVVAGCGRVTGVGPDGQVSWRTERSTIDDPRTRVLPIGAAVAVLHVGSRTIELLDAADGDRVWRRRLDAPARDMVAIGGESIAFAARDDAATWIGAIDAERGELAWQRRWRGWRETALASDGRRVVAGMVDSSPAESCARSGVVDLDARSGSTNAIRRLDARLQVRGLGADAATSRMAALVGGRSCSIEQVAPRIDVYRARGLERVRQAAMPARPCSNLAVQGRLALVATCDELVAVDTLTGRRRWSIDLEDVATRGSMSVSTSSSRVFVTDDVGTLRVVERATATG